MLLYVLQTHLPDSLNSHIRPSKSFAFGARIEAFRGSPASPPISPRRCVWRFYSSILALAPLGQRQNATIEAPNASVFRSFPKSIIFPMKTHGFRGGAAVQKPLPATFSQLIYKIIRRDSIFSIRFKMLTVNFSIN